MTPVAAPDAADAPTAAVARTSPPQTASRQLVVFTLQNDEYALPIGAVQEIIRYRKPRRLGTETPWIAGVISLRGQILSVCDLGVHLRHSAIPGPNAKIVIIDCERGSAGVVVDEVTGVLNVDRAQLAALPGAGPGFMHEIAQVGDRLIVIIDPDDLLVALGVADDGEAAPSA